MARILAYLNSLPNCHAEKVHGSPYGMPSVDITGCLCGRRLEIEVKVPGRKATKQQVATLERWAKVGAITGCVTCVDEARALLAADDSAHLVSHAVSCRKARAGEHAGVVVTLAEVGE